MFELNYRPCSVFKIGKLRSWNLGWLDHLLLVPAFSQAYNSVDLGNNPKKYEHMQKSPGCFSFHKFFENAHPCCPCCALSLTTPLTGLTIWKGSSLEHSWWVWPREATFTDTSHCVFQASSRVWRVTDHLVNWWASIAVEYVHGSKIIPFL